VNEFNVYAMQRYKKSEQGLSGFTVSEKSIHFEKRSEAFERVMPEFKKYTMMI
jgi:hypothetical protein